MDSSNTPFFPLPAPGETIYSVLFRYVTRSGLQANTAFKFLLNKRKASEILTIIPDFIVSLSQTVNRSHPWSDPINILLNHTIFNYLCNLRTNSHVDNLINRALDPSQARYVAIALGASMQRQPKQLTYPRYCKLCAIDDLNSLGFTYFHREHQLPSVITCWRHNEPLFIGCKKCGPYPIKGSPSSLPSTCNCSHIDPLAITNIPPSKPLLWLAQQSALLTDRQISLTPSLPFVTRKALLHNQNRTKQLDLILLAKSIKAVFGNEYLTFINFPPFISEKPSPWITRILRSSVNQTKKPVFLYLLLIGSHFNSIEEIYNLAKRPHSNESFKNHSHASDHLMSTLLINTEKSSFSIDLFMQLISSGNFTLDTIAKKLGTTFHTLANFCLNNNIRFPMPNRLANKIGNKVISNTRADLLNGVDNKAIMDRYKFTERTIIYIKLNEPSLYKLHRNAAKLLLREKHRAILTDYVKDNTEATRNDIVFNLPSTYDYLIKNDKQWFFNAIPFQNRQRPHRKSHSGVNWTELDKQMSDHILAYITITQSQEHKPIWLTETYLTKQSPLFSRYWRNKKHFPKTLTIINRHKESYEDFVKRKIQWALSVLEKKNRSLSILSLRTTAGLPAGIVKSHKIFILDKMEMFNFSFAPKSFFTD
ncbi:TnsD family Tn7-like transposition protein [Desulfocurvibacter africanus]|uniref:TnsD family Tn7-like transposition protein n=1 Tax=Desulfocurvibacter africanus TaxID=873 RepID=UPI0003F7A219|nr:TnsD family Tn7-like transposition protein [Desulfocurvibacter africanus]